MQNSGDDRWLTHYIRIFRHIFTDISLLKLALTHRSAGTPNSDTLAWVGDAALHIVVTEQLAAVYGCLAPGEMTVLRSSLESREKFRECALEIGLDKLMVIGKSILVSNAKATDSMLAESFEAVLGAVYIDGGIEAVRKAYCSNFPLQDDVYKRKRHLEL
jgi:ribonuclease-3